MLLLVSALVMTPVVMDEVRDIYLHHIVAPKAHPVYVGGRILASSFQLQYKGHKFTITNKHVCDSAKAEDKSIRASGPSPVSLDVYANINGFNRSILKVSKLHDLCILAPLPDSPTFSLASSVQVGESVSIIGHPRGFKQSISDGRLVNKIFEPSHLLPKANIIMSYLTTANAYPGNSGSPVINRWGNVIGVLYAGHSQDYTNINYVVPLTYLKAELDDYLNGY